MQTYAEIEQIMKAEQTQVNYLWDAVKDLLKEAFVTDETEIGALRWESILNIDPLDTDSLKVRNFRIKSRLIEDLPYTYRTLNSQIKALCGAGGYEINLEGDTFTLNIKVALTAKKFKKEVENLCERVVPLNLFINITLMYNTHELLHPYTHGHLHYYSHQQLRDEPFEA